jgi:Mrp family chromosome partitioning ATPase
MAMAWGLILLAEIWRLRWRVGLPMLVGMALTGFYTLTVPQTFEARALLQVQTEQARAPLLKDMAAPGERAALMQIVTDADLLHDTGTDSGRKLVARRVTLDIVNSHMIAIGYRDTNPRGLEQVVDTLAYNFIQALLAPERLRIEQILTQNRQELAEVNGRLATSDGKDSTLNGQLTARQAKLQGDIVQLQSDLRAVNTSAQGSQALVWFAESSHLQPAPGPKARLLANLFWGLVAGLLYVWFTRGLPKQRGKLVMDAAQAAEATGMPVIGTLPWLGKLRLNHHGSAVVVQGKTLKPSDFSELERLQRTLVRGLRGPMVLLGPVGNEGVSTLALLLAEKTAAQGKKVVLADLNLKNRTLSHWLGLGDGNWELPKGKAAKGKWDALQSLPGQPNLMLLAAPRHPETMQKLAEVGGVPALFEHLQSMADVVIVDASPLAAMNRGNVDAVAVAVAGARSVLVAQAEETAFDTLKRATDSLLLVGAPLLGVVLNRQHSLTRRQLLGQVADRLHFIMPPLGTWLRRKAAQARLD